MAALPEIVDISQIIGLIRTRDSVPVGTPRKFSEQMVFVVTGGNASLYVYDALTAIWRSIGVNT